MNLKFFICLPSRDVAFDHEASIEDLKVASYLSFILLNHLSTHSLIHHGSTRYHC